jgi:4a-hydroxytetrahydrobiopterin dehydratase
MEPLNNNEVKQYLDIHLKNWSIDEKSIKREFTFRNFVEAFAFMTAVGLESEKANHHPDWANSYNKVNISLSTHSAGGITNNDLDLAARIETIYYNLFRS